MPFYVVRKLDGVFVSGGGDNAPFLELVDQATQAIVQTDRFVDSATERWDAVAGVVRRATAVELAADADAALAAEASRLDIKTTVVWTLKRLLGRNPTLAEINAAKTEWIAVRKAIS